MIIIKNSEELAKLVNEHKDLILPDKDVRIEYQVDKGELRNVECGDLYLMNDEEKFNFIGENFDGGNFKGRNFDGWDFNGWDFNGGDFNGKNFNGWNFNGKNFNGWNFNGKNFNGLDFNGKNFKGRNFDGWDFNGWDFNGGDFNGLDFNGKNFNGSDFNGKKVSYHGFFNCYGSIKCESIEGRREPHSEPVSLTGEIIIKDKNNKPK